MRKFSLLLVGIALTATAFYLLSAASPRPLTANGDDNDNGGMVFVADLSGDEEVPPVTTDTTGSFKIVFNDDFTAATYRLEVEDGIRVTQAHIHCGEAGVNGPVVVFLAGFHDRGWDVDGIWIDNATVTDFNIVNDACGDSLLLLAAAMAAGEMYVNVHTIGNPGGEVRGQIMLADDGDDDDD